MGYFRELFGKFKILLGLARSCCPSDVLNPSLVLTKPVDPQKLGSSDRWPGLA